MSFWKKKPSIKKLESYLQELKEFKKPKILYEQYATPPHIAASILHTIDTTYNGLEGKLVADLGCGTCRLTIGSILCGAEMVYGFEIDADAIETAVYSISDFLGEEDILNITDASSIVHEGLRSLNIVRADIASSRYDQFWEPWHDFFDTVIMNPPFGTKQEGLDMKFLKRAIDICKGHVYSLHKTTTRHFIEGMTEQWGVEAKPIAQIKYDLKCTYGFHKKGSVDIEVDLWQIKCN